MKQPLLLSLLALLATSALAQDPATTQETTDAATTADVTTTAATTAATTADAKPTDDANVPALADTTQTPAATTTAATTREPNDDGNIPTASSGDGSYSYPAPSVPPTQNAPFMHQSDLPQGTVFIIVGAILGAFGAAVLLWRAVIGCLLHRSVKRAALEQHRANDKMGIPGVPAGAGAAMAPPFYTYTDHASNGSLGATNPSAGRGVRRTQRGPMPSATPSQTNLFFSPTAPAGAPQANRSSTFLPSGFYAAGQGAPAHGPGYNASASDLRPGSNGHGRPSDSPGPMPRPDPQRRNVSTSSVNMARPTSQRPPSMFLDDLLGDQPGHYPPPHNQNWGRSRDRL